MYKKNKKILIFLRYKNIKFNLCNCELYLYIEISYIYIYINFIFKNYYIYLDLSK